MPQSQVMVQIHPHPTLPLSGRALPRTDEDGVLAREAARLFEERGVTFGVLEDGEVRHRPIPFDPMPRTLSSVEWKSLERGLLQRTLALDTFVRDVYGSQRILRAGRIPAHHVYGSLAYLRGASSPTAQRPGQIAVAGIDPGK